MLSYCREVAAVVGYMSILILAIIGGAQAKLHTCAAGKTGSVLCVRLQFTSQSTANRQVEESARPRREEIQRYCHGMVKCGHILIMRHV